MRYWACIILFFVYSNAIAQGSEKSLHIAVDGFTNALVYRDTAELKQLVDDRLVYGHSNGWKQTKRELINDLYNGKLIYKHVNQSEEQAVVEGNTGCVRATMQVDVEMEGKPMQFKLHVLQVWVWKNKKWLLLSRQSTKIN